MLEQMITHIKELLIKQQDKKTLSKRQYKKKYKYLSIDEIRRLREQGYNLK